MEKSIYRTPPTAPIITQYPKKITNLNNTTAKSGFSEHLRNAIDQNVKLTVSKHAKQRLEQRNIIIDDSKWKVIEKKVQEAKGKGVQDSLVVLNNAALIISAKNNTVITAMDRNEASTQIFTNINGTIIVD